MRQRDDQSSHSDFDAVESKYAIRFDKMQLIYPTGNVAQTHARCTLNVSRKILVWNFKNFFYN
jgi:hypothetical protein